MLVFKNFQTKHALFTYVATSYFNIIKLLENKLTLSLSNNLINSKPDGTNKADILFSENLNISGNFKSIRNKILFLQNTTSQSN